MSLVTLLLYYTQDFSEDLELKNFINYQELEIQTSQRGSDTYLTSARGELGTLTLTNKGYFTEVYKFPKLIGCIDLKSSASSDIRNFHFILTMLSFSSYSTTLSTEILIGMLSEP